MEVILFYRYQSVFYSVFCTSVLDTFHWLMSYISAGGHIYSQCVGILLLIGNSVLYFVDNIADNVCLTSLSRLISRYLNWIDDQLKQR